MKRNVFVLLGLLACVMTWAAPVSTEEARRKAELFVKQRTANARGGNTVTPTLTEVSVGKELYAFNIGQRDGFVIVSGDDRTDAILGYADSGRLSADDMPDNLRSWLESYADEIRWAAQHAVSNTAGSRAARVTAIRRSVAPMLTCEWNQSEPYNNYCPVVKYQYNNAPYELKQAVTGCVATATAQIMYYHGRQLGAPTTMPKGTPAYNSTKTGLFAEWVDEQAGTYNTTNTVAAKAARSFDWSKMVDFYPTASDEANEEVARLMEYVGAAVQMQYGSSSSASTSAVPGALVEYFGYDSDAKTIYRNDYGYQEWLDAIYDELTTNGPVLFGGQSVGGGHAFVIDGYSEDDFFHVNWGWGGQSNGYYRLSALNPTEQGIGGSTSTDGYNYDQDVMVNVKAEDDGESDNSTVRLTSQMWKFASQPSAVWSEYNHKYFYDNSGFHYLNLTYKIANNTGQANTFGWGVAIYKDDEMVQLIQSTWTDFANGSYLSGNTGSLDFNTKLEDGDYRIICVSRKSGTNTWYPNYDSDLFYIKATVTNNGNNIAFENIAQDRTVQLSGTLELSGEAVQNQPVTMIAKLSNTGYKYNGTVQLIWKSGDKNYRMAARQIDVESGAENKVFEFPFTPTSTGEYELVLWDKDNRTITAQSTTITVAPAPAATNGTLEIVSTVLKNGDLANHEVYGTTARATVTVRNTGATDHTSGLKVWLFHWTTSDGIHYSGSSVDGKLYELSVPAGQTATLDVEIDGMEIGDEEYGFGYYYANGNQISTTPFFKAYEGITTYTADGTESTSKKTSTVAVADDVAVVDISGVAGITEVTPNSNPNTLYFVSEDVSGLEGKNVVKNGVAEELNISDEQPFYTPKSFTATHASYTRRFTQGADGTGGWTTIVLPFDVKQVKQGDRTIDWFHSGSDSGKHFWVKEFTSDGSSTVNFGFADKMVANTPYIIAVPGNQWGENWNLTNKDITFYGEDAAVVADAAASLSGNNYRFVGGTRTAEADEVYVMNGDGNAFQKEANATVAPFRAYFKATNISYATALAIGSDSDVPTPVGTLRNDDNTDSTDGAIYSLDGRRVKSAGKGIYIVNGKKVVK